MNKLLLPLGLAAALLCPIAAHAQPDSPPPSLPTSTTLTLAEAQALAAQRSLLLSAARHALDASAGGLQQAGALPNPVLTTSVEDTRSATRTTTATLDFPVELGGKRNARLAAAERSRQLAQAELALAQARLRASVLQAYFAVLIAQQRVALAAQSTDLAARSEAAAAKRVAAGRVSPLDETRARVDHAQAQLEAAEADAELQSARHTLAALWGDTAPQFTDVSGDVDQIPERGTPAELARLLDDAPDMAVARLTAAQHRDLAAIERSKGSPDVTVSVGARRDNDLGRTQATLGLSVPLPFFDRNQGAIREAEHRAAKADDEHQAARLHRLNELQAAVRQLAAAQSAARMLHATVLPAAEQAHDGATKAFEAGKFSGLDLLDAQRALLQARSRYLTALTSAHQAASAIDRLIGRQPHSLQP